MNKLPIEKSKKPVTVHGKTKTFIQMREEGKKQIDSSYEGRNKYEQERKKIEKNIVDELNIKDVIEWKDFYSGNDEPQEEIYKYNGITFVIQKLKGKIKDSKLNSNVYQLYDMRPGIWSKIFPSMTNSLFAFKEYFTYESDAKKVAEKIIDYYKKEDLL